MFRTKPTSRFIFFTLTLILLLSLFTSIIASDPSTNENDDDDLEGVEELLALDEEVEREEQEGGSGLRSSEAEVLTKAQRIVLELNGENTKKVIDDNEFVLVLGYAPWCPRSAELMPQFAEAATSLKELGSPLLMAKLDAERYPKAASLLEIKGFPTLLLFVNGTSQAYTDGFTAEEVVIWARKKSGVPVIRISSVTEAEEIVKKYHTYVVGFFEKFEEPEYKEFLKAAAADNEIQFIEASNIEVANILFPNIEATNRFLGIVKNEPERYTTYEGTFEMEKVLQFLDHNKFTLVTKLTEINSVKVYSGPIIKLQSLVVHNLYVGEGTDFTGVPTKMLTVNVSLRLSVYNPATTFGIHVSSAPINLVYSKITVATGQLKKYYQPRKSRRSVQVNLEGVKVPLYGAGSRLVVSQNGRTVVPLTLKLEIRSRGNVVGKPVRTKHRKLISCPLTIDSLSTKPIKFKKNSCTYQ